MSGTLFDLFCYAISFSLAASSFKEQTHLQAGIQLFFLSSSGSHITSPPVANFQTSTAALKTLHPEGRRGVVNLFHTDRHCDYRTGKKNPKIRPVTPDHYPQSTAFTNSIKGMPVRRMLYKEGIAKLNMLL